MNPDMAVTRDIAPAIVDLWGGGYGDYPAAINQAGVVVGRHGRQIVMWDRGTVTEVASSCPFTGCMWDDIAPVGINARGQVVGTQNLHAFLWDKGALTDLGASFGRSFASWINEAGDVLGGAMAACAGSLGPYLRSWAPGCGFHAVLWQKGTPIDLGTLGGNFSDPAAINSAGDVVGSAELAHGRYEEADVHAFIWKDGIMTDLGTLGGHSSAARAINSAGQVVGLAENADGVPHAVPWDHGNTIDLGEGTACAINASGQIAGVSSGSAIVWDHGTKIDLGVSTNYCGYFGEAAPTINDAGEVALSSCTGSYYQTCSAYVWNRGVLTTFRDLGGHTVVFGINPRGWIVGQSITVSGDVPEWHAVLWTP